MYLSAALMQFPLTTLLGINNLYIFMELNYINLRYSLCPT